MKKYLILFFAMVICGIQNGFSQDNNPKKGYYSVYPKNQERSAIKNPVILPYNGKDFPKVEKGYYSMNGHNRKLPLQTRISLASVKPVAPKGYYSVPVFYDSTNRKKRE